MYVSALCPATICTNILNLFRHVISRSLLYAHASILSNAG